MWKALSGSTVPALGSSTLGVPDATPSASSSPVLSASSDNSGALSANSIDQFLSAAVAPEAPPDPEKEEIKADQGDTWKQ